MIMGTSLSVAMIMVLILICQARTASYSPVSNRSKLLYVNMIEGKHENGGGWRSGAGYRVTRECFYRMKTPVAVTALTTQADRMRLSAPGIKQVRECKVRMTDATFWKVFDFQFLSGAGYTEELFVSALPVAVIDEQVATGMFGSIDVIGQTIRLDYVDYTIQGVVKPVSEAVTEAYGEIWIPYSVNKYIMTSNDAEGIGGRLQICLLAQSSSDFDAIRQEAQSLIASFNAGQTEWKANIWKQPITSLQTMFYFVPEDRLHGNAMGMLMLAALFLFVPVFNLLGITFSQMQKRKPEIGLRKAFGATSKDVIGQVLWENLVITLIGSVIGLVLSILFFYIAKDSLLERKDIEVQVGMFLQPTLFVAAFFICLLINLLSAGIPAWRTTRLSVINSFNSHE